MTRSTFGSSASATAGGRSRVVGVCEGGANEIVRFKPGNGATAVALAIWPPNAVERAAISNGSWGGRVRVAFGITVLLKRSLLGFSSGATGFGAATDRSFLARAWSLT